MQALELFTTALALAMPKSISHAGLEASQIDFYEINEAFAVRFYYNDCNFISFLMQDIVNSYLVVFLYRLWSCKS